MRKELNPQDEQKFSEILSYSAAILLIIVISLSLFSVSCTKKSEISSKNMRAANYKEENTESHLPISERGFYIGVLPNPKTSQQATAKTYFENLDEAYKEAGEIAEVSMVWVEKQGIGEYDVLKRNKVVDALRVYGLMPVITLNFATLKKVGAGKGIEYVVDSPPGIPAELSAPEFREAWVEEARKIALEFKPEYFSLGNEINDYFYFHPEDIDDYFELFESAKREIKRVSPDTKVMVVFSYNHVIENEQWSLVEEFDSRADIIGFTTYPWKQYDDPEELPADYYSRIKNHVKKPIAFTEIGWISSEPSSEEEQARFLLRFLELTKELDMEMVNWLFLHEMNISGMVAQISRSETGSISLRRSDGSEKPVYHIWIELKKMKMRKKR